MIILICPSTLIYYSSRTTSRYYFGSSLFSTNIPKNLNLGMQRTYHGPYRDYYLCCMLVVVVDLYHLRHYYYNSMLSQCCLCLEPGCFRSFLSPSNEHYNQQLAKYNIKAWVSTLHQRASFADFVATVPSPENILQLFSISHSPEDKSQPIAQAITYRKRTHQIL